MYERLAQDFRAIVTDNTAALQRIGDAMQRTTCPLVAGPLGRALMGEEAANEFLKVIGRKPPL